MDHQMKQRATQSEQDNRNEKQALTEVTPMNDEFSKDVPGLKGYKRSQDWKTPAIIVGFYFSALVLAIGHLVFFKRLDGAVVDDESISQSWVTSISLLLVTAFRASLLGAVGTSFTQHLWHVFRQKALRVSLIEQLFRVRSNPIGLANPQVIRNAPIIFSIALYAWLVPIATIYPPGALTVASQPYTTTQNLNIPILNPPAPDILDPLKITNTFPLLFWGVMRPYWSSGAPQSMTLRNEYDGPIPSLSSISTVEIASGQLVNLPSPGGQNSSYILTFRAPRLKCNESTHNSVIINNSQTSITVFNASWNSNNTFSIARNRFIGYFPQQQSVGGNNQPPDDYPFSYLTETKELVCKTYFAFYTLNVSHTRGFLESSFSLKNEQPFNVGSDKNFVWDLGPGENYQNFSLPTTPQFKNYVTELKNALEEWNIFALLDAPLTALKYTWGLDPSLDKDQGSAGTHTLPNGTQIELGRTKESRSSNNVPHIISESIFNTQRYNNTFVQGGSAANYFDPRDFNLTETSINELLTNVTISTLSLDVWRAKTDVNVTIYRNTYEFSNPLNLILPYALCLALGIPAIVVGILALRSNEVPAIDGGFLQILTTTTGRTNLEQLASKASLGGENASKDLLDLKVRFGELLYEDGVGQRTRRAGFGTLGETVPLKKGVKYGAVGTDIH